MTSRLTPIAFALAVLPLTATAAPVEYKLDPNHTFASLEMDHMGLSIWRGKFNKTAGRVSLDLAAKQGTVEASIESASIDWGHEEMNEHSRAPDWLNVIKFPQITYQGKLVFEGDQAVAVDGELTLLGVSQPVRLTLHRFVCKEHPYYKKPVCGADAEAEFNRRDFGLTQYADGEAGKIRVRIQAEALGEAPTKASSSE